MLDAAVRTGLGSVEQLAALVVGARPVELGSEAILQAGRAVAKLRRRGWVEADDLAAVDDPLPPRRGRERYWLGRPLLREERMEVGVYGTMALQAVRAAPPETGIDGVALREAMVILEPADLERMLEDLVAKDLVRRTRLHADDTHQVVWPTEAGLRHWARRRRALQDEPVAPPRTPAPRYRLHHVLTVEAALELMAAGAGSFVGFVGDGDIRAVQLAGRPIPAHGPRSVAPMSVGPVPDGEIRWRTRSGQLQTARVEILTSSYSESQMLGKKGLADVHIFTSSPVAADRARRLGFRGVHLLDGRPLRPAGSP
jgi:DNA-binding MarR family transcriptional regulator